MSTTTVRRGMTIAGLALAAALAAACGPGRTAGTEPTTTDAAGGAEAVGTAGPDAAGGVATSGPTTEALPPPILIVDPTDMFAPTYPDTAEEYAQAVMQAWAGDDPSWLEALTTESAYYGIVDLNASPYDEWTLLRCDGTAGSSYCSFSNPDADVLTLRISHQLLGHAHAATEVTLDKTVYPNDSLLYVKEFVKAWQSGNTARMLKLSSPAVVNKVPDTAPTSVTYLPVKCCGGGLAQVKVKIGNPTARFDVGTTKLGGPNAILDYTVEFGISG